MMTYRNLINVDALSDLVDAHQCRTIDCRFDLLQPEKGREEYVAGHIPGALYADLDNDLAGPVSADSGRHPLPDMTAFQTLVNSWGIDADSQIVVYDHANGAIAARLWWLMRWVGHANVAVLNGGIAAWSRSNRRLTTEVPEMAPGHYYLRPDPDMLVSTDDVAAMVRGDSSFNLLDARDGQRFAGRIEPIDPVAGHVPGARNLPFAETLSADGTWRDPAELLALWEQALQAHPDTPTMAMCGSGVTACHLLVTADLLGLRLPTLYAGSWSEWIRDTSRPVSSGV